MRAAREGLADAVLIAGEALSMRIGKRGKFRAATGQSRLYPFGVAHGRQPEREHEVGVGFRPVAVTAVEHPRQAPLAQAAIDKALN